MIVGVGTDIVETKRIEDKLQREEFVLQVFAKNEIEYCRKQKNAVQHFAARFCAKEAFLKAIGEGLLVSYDLSEIEIVLDEKGKPSIQLHGTFLQIQNEKQWKNIHVSLSHIAEMACAFVVIENQIELENR